MKTNLFEFLQHLRDKKEKLKELSRKLKEWAEAHGNDELHKLCKDFDEEVQTLDDGSNPPTPPPGHKPPGGG